MVWRRLLILVSAASISSFVMADEPSRSLRFAAIAPDGTSWARESRAFAREVEDVTAKGVRIKWYFGGIAGDEMEELERLRRGQLHGIAGTVYCERLAPSLRALEVVGMVGSTSEASSVLKALSPQVEEELAKTPFRTVFTTLGFGHRVLFSRKPVRSMADLRAGRYWVWELDDVLRTQLPAMGLNVVPLPLADAARAYEDNRVDGFIVIPTAALAFQYSTLAKYFTDLGSGYLPGCLVMSRSAMDALPYNSQLDLMSAAAKLRLRVEDIGIRMDEQLLGSKSLFGKQGLLEVPMSSAFRAEWVRDGRAAYRRLATRLVPDAAARQVLESHAGR